MLLGSGSQREIGSGLRIYSLLGFRVQGLGFRAQVLECSVGFSWLFVWH